MKPICHTLCLCLLLLTAACGPKEVGEGSATPEPGPGRDPAVELRYPMGNNPVQQRLYMLNQPQTYNMHQQMVRQHLAPPPGQDAPEKKELKTFGPFRE